MRRSRSSPPVLALIALIIGGVFLLDSVTSHGYAAWLLYTVSLLLTAWVPRRRLAYGLAALCTLLIVAGYFLPLHGVHPAEAVLNRTLGAGALWALAVLLEWHKQAEQTRWAEQSRLEAVFAAIPGVVVEYDAELRPVRANQAALDAVGLSSMDLTRDQVVARLGFRYLDGRIVARDDLPSSRALRGEEVAGEQFTITTADGRARVVSVSAIPLRRGEAITGVVALWHDITPLKEAEGALRASEQRFVLIFEQAAVPMALARCADGTLVEVNEQWVKLFGYSKQEAQGKRSDELAINRDTEDRSKTLAEICERGSVRDREMTLFTRLGEARFVSANIDMVVLDGERYLLSTVYDLTERKQAEEALQESEKRLRLAQDIALVGTFDWDIRTDLNIWTPELEAMYGLPRGGFAQTEAAWEQLVHPEDRAGTLALVEQAFESGEPMEGEWRVIWPDGSVHWVAGRWQVLKDESGAPVRMIGVNTDITARKQAEQQRQQLERAERQRAFLSAFLDNAPIAMAYLDRDLRYVHVNPMYLQVSGRSREEVMGRVVLSMVDEEAKALLRRGQAGETVQREEMPYEFVGQRKAYLDVALVPVRDEYGEVDGVVLAVVDVTSQVQTRERAVAAERARAELAETLNAEVNHRVKNNLAMAAGMLQTQGLTEHDPRVATPLHDAASRLLTLAQVHEQLQVNPEGRVDLLAGLRRLTESAREMLASRGADFSVEGDPVELPSRAATNLLIVANELLTNAVKYCAPDGGEQCSVWVGVRVGLALHEGTLVLSVWNSGNPVPEGFDPRAQAGLGLRLIYGLAVEPYQGVFTLRAEAGGTLAEVTVPWEALQER